MARTPTRRWLIPFRVAAFTILATLLSFAVSLFLAILGVILYARIRGMHPNMALAYRDVAFPVAASAGAIALIVMISFEIRQHREAKVLDAIARASQVPQK